MKINMEPKIIGNRIKKLMKKQNISIEELSKEMQISIVELDIKLEGHEEFSIEDIRKIKDVFKLDLKTLDEIFFKEECKI